MVANGKSRVECPNCGALNAYDALSCSLCAAILRTKDPTPQVPEQKGTISAKRPAARVGRKAFLGSIAAILGGFALILCLLSIASRDMVPGDFVGGILLTVSFLAACAVGLPSVLVIHAVGLLIAKRYLRRLPLIGVLHTSFFFPAAVALLMTLIGLVPAVRWLALTAAGMIVFPVLPALYILALIGWLRLIDRTVLSEDPALHWKGRVFVAVLVGYGGWAYWPKVQWRKLIAGTLVHIVGGVLLVMLTAWFWNKYVDQPLGPISDGKVPFLALIPVTVGVWLWAVWDAARDRVRSPEGVRLERYALAAVVLVCLVCLCLVFPLSIAEGPAAVLAVRRGMGPTAAAAALRLGELVENDRLDPLTRRRALDALVDAIVEGEDSDVCFAAAAAIGPFGEPAAERLAGWLRDGSTEEQRRACRGLGSLGTHGADPLLEALDRAHPEVVCVAMSSLISTGDPRAAEAVSRMLAHGNPGVRRRAVDALASIGEAGASFVIRALGDSERIVRVRATRALCSLKAAAVPHLIKALPGANADKRRCIAEILGSSGDTGATRVLTRMLYDPDREVRMSAGVGLEALKDPDSIGALMAVLKAPDVDASTKGCVARALGQLGVREAVPFIAPLLALSGDEARSTREAAVAALCGIESEEAVRLLIGILEDENADPRVHRMVVDMAGQKKNRRMVLPIAGILRRSKRLRAPAVRALCLIGDPRAVDAWIWVLETAQRPDEETSHSAMIALGVHGGERAIEPLIGVVDRFPNRIDMRMALSRLRKIGSPRAVELLLGLAEKEGSQWSRSYRGEVEYTLGVLTGTKGRTPLAERLARWRQERDRHHGPQGSTQNARPDPVPGDGVK